MFQIIRSKYCSLFLGNDRDDVQKCEIMDLWISFSFFIQFTPAIQAYSIVMSVSCRLQSQPCHPFNPMYKQNGLWMMLFYKCYSMTYLLYKHQIVDTYQKHHLSICLHARTNTSSLQLCSLVNGHQRLKEVVKMFICIHLGHILIDVYRPPITS